MVQLKYICLQIIVINAIGNYQGWMVHWDVYFTCPQSFIIPKVFLFICLTPLIVWFIKLSVQTFLQPLMVIYRMVNFVYHHWGCTYFFRSLSYPFRSRGNYHFKAAVK